MRWAALGAAVGVSFPSFSPGPCAQEVWTRLATAVQSVARTDYALAFDSRRNVIVMFDGGVVPETWEWDGFDWSLRHPRSSPGRRGNHGMAYDSGRDIVVLYGGEVSGTSRETWEWDGTDWRLRSPTRTPYAWAGFGMAYDEARGVTVLFGGAGPSATWSWDGVDWVELQPSTRPPARAECAMVYDAARQRIVMFGGHDRNVPLGDTWEWDGDDWVRVAAVGPSPRSNHAMAYDRVRERAVLFGGEADCCNRLDDTWEWDGQSWRRVAANAPGPGPESRHAMASHGRHGVLLFETVLFGPITASRTELAALSAIGRRLRPERPGGSRTPAKSRRVAYRSTVETSASLTFPAETRQGQLRMMGFRKPIS